MNVAIDVIDLTAMRASSDKASALLKVLANPDRLLLLCQLTKGEQCVSDLEQTLGLQQPSLSQQLTVLRQAKLVSTRREGKQIYYSITSTEAQAVMQLLYSLFCQSCREVG
ncbi:MAG: transcriptional regulator [Betaproteobacteria bacterium HGW-Betaproteobacteria-2]|jgi:ArsR family transcriptional regulator|nr:MAG: transcriptional regulator [Betaproteobacteria bacterium HGW-Betaproteobacteria-2]PKO92520.1 MAG: transcriptional regulator [Betaproteobacteria bacterium HGW-Betaproteobacteria-1]